MAVPSDLVRIELLALAMNASMNAVRRAHMKGRIPPPDLLIRQAPRPTSYWKLSTLHAHDPELGRRCAALLAVTALMPKTAA